MQSHARDMAMDTQTLKEEITRLEAEVNRRYGEIDELIQLIKIKKEQLRELEKLKKKGHKA
jgi:hypothetical protein